MFSGWGLGRDPHGLHRMHVSCKVSSGVSNLLLVTVVSCKEVYGYEYLYTLLLHNVHWFARLVWLLVQNSLTGGVMFSIELLKTLPLQLMM